MAITDRINQGLERLTTSPLGMAGLGLLMQPSMSRQPINPFEYAAQGMQLGIQNKARQQQIQAEQERQAENDAMRRARYLMDIQRMQNERIQQEEAAIQARQQQQAMQEYMASLPPEEQRLAAVMGPEYAKQMMMQRMQPTKPTNLMQNLEAAGLRPGTREYRDAMLAAATRPQVQVGMGPQIKPPTGYMLNPEGTGVVPIPGLPVKPAALSPGEQAQEQMKAKQEFARQVAAREMARFQQFFQEKGNLAALSVQDRKDYNTYADAVANALAKFRGTPGAEPPKESIEAARKSLPTLEELAYPSVMGNIAGSKLRILMEELGVPSGMPTMTPAGAPVTTDFQREKSGTPLPITNEADLQKWINFYNRGAR